MKKQTAGTNKKRKSSRDCHALEHAHAWKDCRRIAYERAGVAEGHRGKQIDRKGDTGKETGSEAIRYTRDRNEEQGGAH